MAFGVTVDFTANVAKFTDQVDRLSGNLDRFGKKAESSFGLAKKAAVGFGSAIGLSAFTSDLIAVNREMESLRARLISVAGTRLGADQSFAFIQDFATNTPFQIDSLTKAFIDLKNLGIEPTFATMEAITNQSAKLGGSQEVLEGIVKALGQAYSKGKLQQEEMLQLIERGVPVYKILEEVTGKNVTQILELSKKGQLSVGVIDQMIAKMGELATGSNAQAMDTLNGRISNLSDSWTSFQDRLLKSEQENIMKRMVLNWSGWIKYLDAQINGIQGSFGPQVDVINQKIIDVTARLVELRKLESSGTKTSASFSFDEGLTSFNVSKQIQRENKTLEKLRGQRLELLSSLQRPDNVTSSQPQDITEKVKKTTFKAPKINIELESQRAEEKLEALNQRVISIFNPDLAAFNRGLANAQDALSTGFFNEDEFKAEVETLATDFNRGTDPIISRLDRMFNPDLAKLREAFQIVTDAQQSQEIGPVDASVNFLSLAEQYRVEFVEPALEGTNQLSEFSSQAARNMQDAFADFLFDPFNDGLDGMLKSFATTLQRMAAEAAASGIFDLFQDSGIGSAIFSGIGDILTGSFHDGGVIGQDSGRMMAVNPIVFAGAERFHSGGYPGLKSDEVPAILQTGERVLSRVEVSLFSKLLQILDSKQSIVDIEKLVAPVFHQGGTVGGYAPHKMIDPLLFLGARRYHDGGTISGGVLSSSSYNTQSGNLGGISISTTVNVSGSETTRDNANRLGDQLNSRIMEVLAQEKRPGGLLNS